MVMLSGRIVMLSALQLIFFSLFARLVYRRPWSLPAAHYVRASSSGRARPSSSSPPAWHSCNNSGRLCGVAPELRSRCLGPAASGHNGSYDPIIRHTLLACVRDRSAALLRVLPSWLGVHGLDEVIIVDWGSASAVVSQLPMDPRVRVISAPLEREWNLARAYNLAAQFARGAVLLKVDSDTWLHADFLRSHRLLEGAFFAGDWQRAPDENAWHLNGVVSHTPAFGLKPHVDKVEANLQMGRRCNASLPHMLAPSFRCFLGVRISMLSAAMMRGSEAVRGSVATRLVPTHHALASIASKHSTHHNHVYVYLDGVTSSVTLTSNPILAQMDGTTPTCTRGCKSRRVAFGARASITVCCGTMALATRHVVRHG